MKKSSLHKKSFNGKMHFYRILFFKKSFENKNGKVTVINTYFIFAMDAYLGPPLFLPKYLHIKTQAKPFHPGRNGSGIIGRNVNIFSRLVAVVAKVLEGATRAHLIAVTPRVLNGRLISDLNFYFFCQISKIQCL